MTDIVDEYARDGADEAPAAATSSDTMVIPRIAIQGFCETNEVARIIEASAKDRRMARAHMKVHMGGIVAANEFYAAAPTPNLIILESRDSSSQLLTQLNDLAGVCDEGTKVIVIGHSNDVVLYRELLRRGVSEYLVAPIEIFDLMRSIADIYHDPDAEPIGRTIAFVGAKGGCGASTVAHNVAWHIAGQFDSNVVVADLDLPFGTVGLDFNQDPPQGIAEAVNSPDRLDDVFLDRLLTKCTDRLSILAAPATLDRSYDFDEAAFEGVIDTVRQSVPAVVLDVPHIWSNWVLKTLSSVDEVVVVVAPDLASLRNAKNLIDYLKQARPNDTAPKLVVNQVGLPKRPEIKPEEIANSLGVEASAIIPFDANLFGTAANNGQMISEIDSKNPIGDHFSAIAQVTTGRAEIRKHKKSGLAPLLDKLRGRKSA